MPWNINGVSDRLTWHLSSKLIGAWFCHQNWTILTLSKLYDLVIWSMNRALDRLVWHLSCKLTGAWFCHQNWTILTLSKLYDPGDMEYELVFRHVSMDLSCRPYIKLYNPGSRNKFKKKTKKKKTLQHMTDRITSYSIKSSDIKVTNANTWSNETQGVFCGYLLK